MPPLLPSGGDGRLARRSRLAGAPLVLLTVSVFEVWSSQVTSRATARAVSAIGLSDDDNYAAKPVVGEESLERKYRVEPGPDVQAMFHEAAVQFVGAMTRVEREETPRTEVPSHPSNRPSSAPSRTSTTWPWGSW